MMHNLSYELIKQNQTIMTLLDKTSLNKRQYSIELASSIGKEYLAFSEKTLDLMQVFWNSAFNKQWFYCPKEYLIQYFGYADSRNTMTHFVQKQLINFIENTDYKIVAADHELVQEYEKLCSPPGVSKKETRGAANKKHYILSGKTIKRILMSTHTDSGREIREYYLQIEELAQFMLDLISDYASEQFRQSKDEVAALKLINQQSSEKLQLFQAVVSNIKQLERNQVFYLASSDKYVRLHLVKYGGCSSKKEIKSRLSTYNTGRARSISLLRSL